jgi:hypothetical protein
MIREKSKDAENKRKKTPILRGRFLRLRVFAIPESKGAYLTAVPSMSANLVMRSWLLD